MSGTSHQRAEAAVDGPRRSHFVLVLMFRGDPKDRHTDGQGRQKWTSIRARLGGPTGARED